MLLALGGCASLERRLEREPDVLQGAVRFYTEDFGDPSCVVAVADSGGVRFSDDSKAHDLYRIASLGKLMYYPVVVKCGLDLDTKVAEVAPFALPPEWNRWTLKDLLYNQTGLPREFQGTFFWFKAVNCGAFGIHIYGDYDEPEEFADELWKPKYRRMVEAGGETYSNMGFGLLGMCISHATGKTSEELLEVHLAEPYGLDDTTFEPESHPEMMARLTPCLAGSLPWDTRRGRPVPENRLGLALRTTGGMFSSASDMAKVFTSEEIWRMVDEAERSGRLKEGDVAGLLRVHYLKDGSPIYYRHGMIYGGSSFVAFEPDLKRVTIVLRNATNWPDDGAYAIVEALRSRKWSRDGSAVREW
jgi:CubicO group peptidase (beta-lactamase class C family)